jgi:sulfane dehydrogenase subunit SoxC
MGKDKGSTAKLLQAVAREGAKLQINERRNFLKQVLLLATEGNLPRHVPLWTKSLGCGVLTNPYGKPSPYESHNVRRNVPWLTADGIA